MISVSDEWRKYFYEYRSHLLVRGILTTASGVVYYLDYEDGDDDFIEMSLADAVSNESSFDVGNFVLNTCTFKLNNSDRKWKNVLLENAKLEPYVGFQHPRLNYALASGNYNTDSDTSAWTASATAFSSYYTITAYDGYMRLYCKTATSTTYYTYLTLTDDFDSSTEYYTITFKVRASASKAINVYAKRENSSGNSSYIQVGTISASKVTASTWAEYSVTFSPDEDYTYTGIGFSMGTFNASGNYLDVEYLIVEQGEEFTEYNRAREDFTENGVEWVKKGTFYISDTGKRGSRISLTAYDNTNAFETSFSGVSITYPITIANFVKKICDYVGVTLATTTFTNSTYSISTAPNTSSTDYTCRQMISYAAMLAGCYARCNVDGELELKWYDSATNIHTIPAYSSIENNEKDTEITGVKVIAMASENVDNSTDDEDSSESTSDEYTYGSDDDYLITIQENPLVPYGNAETIAKLIGAQIVGTTFRSSEISALYDPSMEAGDTVQTENEDGDTVTFYAANISVSLGSYASIRCSSSEDGSGSGSTSVLSYIMGQTADLVNAKFYNFITKNLSAEIANIGYLTADEISATYIATDELQAKVAELGYVSADTLDASVANILKLTTSELYAAVADLGYLTADSVIADDVTAKTLVADVASITSLLSGNIGTGTLQAIHITGDNVIFDEAVITDAAIVSLTADKITSGTIYTDLVTIQSNADDTSLWINGSVIQMSDGSTVRVQLGKDASGTYNFYIWDADGNLMWDALGVTAEGLNDGIIVDANIADDANINESKIDMQSVAERLNEDGSITVDYANIIVNDTTLDYALASVTTAANNAQSVADAVATTLETELEVVQGQISAIVSETGIENLEDGTSIYDLYSEINATVGDITSEVSGIKTFIGDDYSTTQTLSSVIEQTITDNTASIWLAVYDNYLVDGSGEEIYAKSASLALVIEDGVGVLSANADHIYFSGGDLVIDTNNFTLDADGNATFSGTLNAATGSFSGKVTATSGSIGGWSITSSSIYRTSSTYGASDGMYFGTSGLSLGSTFTVSSSGVLTATSGTVGGWTITSGKIYNKDGEANGTAVMQMPASTNTYVFAAGGSSHSSYSDCPFRVTKAGTIYASDFKSTGTDDNGHSQYTYVQDGLITGKVYDDVNSKTVYWELGGYGTGLYFINSSGATTSWYGSGGCDIGGELTVTGLVYSDYSSFGFIHDNSSVGYSLAFGVANSGNRGVYDDTNADWIVYKNSSNDQYLRNPDGIIGIISNRIDFYTTEAKTTDNTGYSFRFFRTASTDYSPTESTAVLLCGGSDSTSAFIRSYPTYSRTGSTAANVNITSSGTFNRYSSSASRYKNTVNYFDNVDYASAEGLAIQADTLTDEEFRAEYRGLLNLPVVMFHYNSGYMTGEADYDYSQYVLGFIAEDVEKILPKCATYTEEGEIEAWDHMQMIPRMVACIQDIYSNVTLIDDRVTILEAQLAEAQLEIVTLKKQLQASAA